MSDGNDEDDERDGKQKAETNNENTLELENIMQLFILFHVLSFAHSFLDHIKVACRLFASSCERPGKKENSLKKTK